MQPSDLLTALGPVKFHINSNGQRSAPLAPNVLLAYSFILWIQRRKPSPSYITASQWGHQADEMRNNERRGSVIYVY